MAPRQTRRSTRSAKKTGKRKYDKTIDNCLGDTDSETEIEPKQEAKKGKPNKFEAKTKRAAFNKYIEDEASEDEDEDEGRWGVFPPIEDEDDDDDEKENKQKDVAEVDGTEEADPFGDLPDTGIAQALLEGPIESPTATSKHKPAASAAIGTGALPVATPRNEWVRSVKKERKPIASPYKKRANGNWVSGKGHRNGTLVLWTEKPIKNGDGGTKEHFLGPLVELIRTDPRIQAKLDACDVFWRRGEDGTPMKCEPGSNYNWSVIVKTSLAGPNWKDEELDQFQQSFVDLYNRLSKNADYFQYPTVVTAGPVINRKTSPTFELPCLDAGSSLAAHAPPTGGPRQPSQHRAAILY